MNLRTVILCAGQDEEVKIFVMSSLMSVWIGSCVKLNMLQNKYSSAREDIFLSFSASFVV